MALQLPGLFTSSIPATVSPRKTSSEARRPLPAGARAGGDEAAAVSVEAVELMLEGVADHLDPRQPERVELGGVGARRRAARDLEDRVEPVPDGPPGLGIAPASLPRERAVRRPDPEREREGAYPVARDGRVYRQDAPGNLLLHAGVAEPREVRVPQGVGAELEPLLRKEAELGEPPGGLLPLDAAVAEEGVARARRGEQAEGGPVAPPGVGSSELEPDAERAGRIHPEPAVPRDVAELAGRGIV